MGHIRRAHRTIRIPLSQTDLAPISEDIDRLLEEADDLSLSPQSQQLLLTLDDEISQDLASHTAEEPPEGGGARMNA